MGLIRVAIRRPLTTLMVFIILFIMGIRSYFLLQIDNFPSIDFPVVSVVTVFPNASPQDVSDLVVEPIEEAVAGISGIDKILSSANEGVGTVTIEFEDGVDGNVAAIEVERRVSGIGGQLPEDAEEPSIIKADIGAIPIMNLVLRGPQTQDNLFDFADEFLVDRFQAIPGVASVNISGGRDQEIHVDVDMEQLSAYKLSLDDIKKAIQDSSETFPVGTIEQGRQKSTIRSVGDFNNISDIENIVVRDGVGGKVFLRNVATIEQGFEDKDQFIRYNGSDAVSISVTKTTDGNTVDVADNLYEILDDVQNDLPAEAELVLVTDASSDIRASVNGVQQDLILAILITGIVMLAFLHRLPTTFIVLFAIPTSLISTLIVMWAMGFTLNQITLLAMTLIIGNLVDDSIVVLENTEYHLGLGKTPAQASIDARQEILLPSLVIASTDLVVYLPVAFMSGIPGQFFFPYGITIVSATVVSLFVGFTLTPMLASKWMKAKDAPKPKRTGLLWLLEKIFFPITWLWSLFTRAWDATFAFLSNFYAGVIRLALANFFTQLVVILIGIGAFAAGIYLVVGGFVGLEIFPQTDDGQFRVEIEMPPGTNLEATDQIVRQVELIILQEVPETAALLTVVGTSSGGGGGPGGGPSTVASNQARINGRLIDALDRERSTTEIIDDLRPFLQSLPEALITAGLNANGPGGSSPVSMEVFGPDADTLIELANQVEDVMASVDGVVDIKNTGASRSPETEVIINRDLAIDQGLRPSDVAGTLRTALSGETVANFETGANTEIDVTLRLDEVSREDLQQVLQLPLGFSNGQPVRLERFASVEETLAPATINRTNRRQILEVASGVQGRAAGDVTNDVVAAIDDQVVFPVGYGFQLSGGSEAQQEIFGQFIQAIILAIALIYILMVALYQSWLQPLAIMISLPVAIVGAFGGLALTNNTVNILSLLGIILLIGIITKNAILLVDFTNQARAEGASRKDALIEAGRRRLRAILMTSFTLVFALMPMLLAVGAGAENRKSLAAVVMGGAISSNLLTLILIPVVYTWFDAGGSGISRFFGWIIGTSKSEDDDTTVSTGNPMPAPQPQPSSSMSVNPEPDAA